MAQTVDDPKAIVRHSGLERTIEFTAGLGRSEEAREQARQLSIALGLENTFYIKIKLKDGDVATMTTSKYLTKAEIEAIKAVSQ